MYAKYAHFKMNKLVQFGRVKYFDYIFGSEDYFSIDTKKGSNRYYRVFRHSEFRKYNFPLSSTKLVNKSWTQASELCRSVGAHLPIIRSSEELDELIALVKLFKEKHVT